jgi:hypothetical protein
MEPQVERELMLIKVNAEREKLPEVQTYTPFKMYLQFLALYNSKAEHNCGSFFCIEKLKIDNRDIADPVCGPGTTKIYFWLTSLVVNADNGFGSHFQSRSG